MKVIQVHNEYRYRGGEEFVVEVSTRLLKQRGIEVVPFTANSGQQTPPMISKIMMFFSGLYSFASYRRMVAEVINTHPDIVHVHNLYPLFSPSVLVACYRMKVPTVMTVQNYRLTCPVGLHLCHGTICEKCSNGRTYPCIVRNCRNSIVESVAYALRASIARHCQLFLKNVTMFIAPTQFTKERILKTGIKEDRVVIIPNTVPIPQRPVDPEGNSYVAYAGRLSSEKGVDTLLSSAATLPHIPVRLAGHGPLLTSVDRPKARNIEFVGWLDQNHLVDFYRGARFLVLPSKWFEVFPLVLLQAMSHGIPVIAAEIGGLPEIVDHGVNGLLFTPGDSTALSSCIQQLWDDPELCRKMGRAARRKVIEQYSETVYEQKLVDVYQKAIEKVRGDKRACMR